MSRSAKYGIASFGSHRRPASCSLAAATMFSGKKAELLLQFFQRRRCPERLHADALAVAAYITRPAESRRLFHRDARRDRIRQDLFAILRVLAGSNARRSPTMACLLPEP